MNVVVSINGRDALPVWSIPYVTSGHISADMLLKRLEDPKYTTPSFPTAFNLDSDKVSLIPKEWWSETKYQLDLLDEELGLTSADRDEWRIRSVTIIMQNRGCYIWLDEFKNWFDKRSIGCSHIGLYLTPTLSPEHQLHFKNTEPKKLKAKVPLDKHDEELQFKKEIANNRLSLCLPEFIELLPVDVSEHNSRFPAFYRLVEEYGLVVHDKTVDGQIVSSFELLEALRQRDQQAYDSLDDYDFDFWEALIKERKYNVERDDVATAYDKAGKTEFPWLSMEGSPVSLNTEDHAKAETTEHELHFENTEPKKLKAKVIGCNTNVPKNRQSQLYIFIWRVYQFLLNKKKPTAQEVWSEIQHRHQDHDIDKIIQEVFAHQISWCSGYGTEQKLSRTSFSKTLSKIKKDPPV